MKTLITLHNLTPYEPGDFIDAPQSALFLKSEDGADWYHSQIFFSPETRKITFDKDGNILSQHNDVSALWPYNASVTELPQSEIPADFPSFGQSLFDWMYNDGVVSRKPIDYIAIATLRRDNEMMEIGKRITALVEAQDDGDITSDELTELASLRERRSKLRRLDLSVAPDINWP